jgi:hypothetical protein
MRIGAHRFKPPAKTRVGGLDLDNIAVEFDESTGRILDFRFELGRGWEILWALPAGPGDRLRLVLVDCAVYDVGDPSLEADPFVVEGDHWWVLAQPLPGGALLEEVRYVGLADGCYRCEVRVRRADGQDEITLFERRSP